MAKKFFWLKLKEDFFRDKRIKKLRRVAGGDTYTLIYLKLQLLSLKNEGKLYFEGVEDNFHQELALEIDEDETNVQFTVMFLMANGLIEECEENEFALIETIQSIGSETSSAERVRKHREQQKALQCNKQVTMCNTEIEIELEKEKEKEKEKENNIVDKIDLVAEVTKEMKTLNNIPKFVKLTSKRKSAINARIQEYGVDAVIDTLKGMNDTVFFSEAKQDKKGWYTLDWIFNPNNFVKIFEGKYNNRYDNNNTNQQQSSMQYIPVQNNLYGDVGE